jgi:hypothetical protein
MLSAIPVAGDMAKRAKAKRKPARRTPPRRAVKQTPPRRAVKQTPPRRAAKQTPPRRAPKHPAANDFDVVVQVGRRTVSVLFRPTNSHYLFRIVADANAKSRARAKPAPDIELHTGTPGDPKAYAESEIFDMSQRLASAAVKDVLP